VSSKNELLPRLDIADQLYDLLIHCLTIKIVLRLIYHTRMRPESLAAARNLLTSSANLPPVIR
jgi:hypothetical protein